MRTVLGLDFGTQGVKGMVVSQDGTILTMAFRHYSFSVNTDGWMEENPDEWVKAADEVIRELKEKGPSVFDTIESIGLSGHMHGVVPIAADGTVLHPCILWCDTRSAKQTEQLHDMLPDDVISRLENPFVTAYSAGKILWLKENCPQVWENTHVFLYCKDYIRYLMTGSVMTDFSDASGSLLYDFRENTWSKQALEAVGLHESQLPPIVPSTCQAGRVTSCGAKIFGLKEGLPVAVGAGDLAASLFGSGISLSNETLVNLGTAGQILALQPKGETRKKGGHLFKFLNDQTDMLLYSIPSAAYCARWYVEQICPFLLEESKRSGKSVFDLLHADAAQSPAGSRGLLFAPYLSGTGSPYFDDMMRGAIIGIDSAHDYRDMGRAILEGVTFGIKQCIETGGTDEKRRLIYLTGGGAKSGLWRQIFADVLESRITCFSVPEAAGIGAAKLAMMACGMDVSEIRIKKESVEPDDTHRKIYRQAYERYTRIYDALKSI